jgi:hypothetical protein
MSAGEDGKSLPSPGDVPLDQTKAVVASLEEADVSASSVPLDQTKAVLREELGMLTEADLYSEYGPLDDDAGDA